MQSHKNQYNLGCYLRFQVENDKQILDDKLGDKQKCIQKHRHTPKFTANKCSADGSMSLALVKQTPPTFITDAQ